MMMMVNPPERDIRDPPVPLGPSPERAMLSAGVSMGCATSQVPVGQQERKEDAGGCSGWALPCHPSPFQQAGGR